MPLVRGLSPQLTKELFQKYRSHPPSWKCCNPPECCTYVHIYWSLYDWLIRSYPKKEIEFTFLRYSFLLIQLQKSPNLPEKPFSFWKFQLWVWTLKAILMFYLRYDMNNLSYFCVKLRITQPGLEQTWTRPWPTWDLCLSPFCLLVTVPFKILLISHILSVISNVIWNVIKNVILNAKINGTRL